MIPPGSRSPRGLPVLLVLGLLVLPLSLAPHGAADHTTGQDRLQCDGGWCQDGEDHVLDCSQGWCQGDPAGFATIVNPSYTETSWLEPDDQVVGVDLGETPKAYPIKVMNYFETIEEHLDDEPVIVTYCPLCGSGVVWSRNVRGETMRFLNTGEIWRNDLVMYDSETSSLWTQVGGEAIQGPLHGWTLDLLPSTVTTWRAWQESHPDTLLLQRPVDEEGEDLAPYDRNPYASYKFSESTPQARHVADESGLHPKARVVGVEHGDEAFAFPVPVMRDQQVLEAEIGGLQLVAGYQGEAVHVYERDNRTFQPDGQGRMVDGQGVVWDIGSGRALEGQGQLERVPSESLFWFAWLEFHPGTGVLTQGQDVIAPEPVQGQREDARSTPWAGTAGLLVALGLAMLVVRSKRP